MTALCSGKICTIFPEKGALNFWKACTIALEYSTYDFNMDHDLDIKPIAKSEAHFNKWIVNYPFYANIHREGVVLYGAASAVENAVEVQVAIISKH